MASHPNWGTYLKDFDHKMFPWPCTDLSNERHSSRLLEQCGFEVISCHLQDHQQSFDSKKHWRNFISAGLRHLRYIPQDKHEEFLDDVEKMASDIHFVSDDYKISYECQIVHARKF
ncbi:hypothetical protein Bbelb_180890 [Branchiostoma belcheri]|nr:hypothetical protein Bbelb_180890 [Branchiostoma belcheri]